MCARVCAYVVCVRCVRAIKNETYLRECDEDVYNEFTRFKKQLQAMFFASNKSEVGAKPSADKAIRPDRRLASPRETETERDLLLATATAGLGWADVAWRGAACTLFIYI